MGTELEQEFFRVLDKNQNKMFIPQDNINYCKVGGYVVGIEIYQNMSGSIKPVIRPSAIYDNAILMQCTGLKDKNGKLIYELDYVRYSNNKYKVEIDKFLGISLTNILNGDTIIMDDIVLFNCEVIGNEFESNTKI